MVPIAPFGWVDNSSPDITATNLEAMLTQAGAYSDYVAARKYPRGPVFIPEDTTFNGGAKGDVVVMNDAAVQSGSTTLTSAAITAPIAAAINAAQAAGAPMHIYVNYAGSAGTSLGTISGATGTSAITTLARTAGAALPSEQPVLLSSGANAQLFNAAAAGANASLTVTSAVPYQNFAIGSALSYGNTGLSTTITAASTGSCTLATPAAATVQHMVAWFGTDDTLAFRAAFTALFNAGGGTLLLDAKTYLLDGAPVTTGNGNAILPLPLLPRGSVAILGTQGVSGGDRPISYTNADQSASVLATTRVTDAYSATNGPPAMIGGPTFERMTNQFPAIAMFRMEDVQMLRPENPQIGGVHTGLVARSEHRRCYCQTAAQVNRDAYNFLTNSASGYSYMGQVPTNAWNFGFYLPEGFNFNSTILSDCGVSGDYVAYVMSAHTELDNCFAQFCNMGIGVAASQLGGQATGVHLNRLNRMGIFDCSMYIGGWDPVNGAKSLANTDNTTTFEGTIGFEAIGNRWGSVAAPFVDVNGRLRGRLIVHNYTLAPTHIAGPAAMIVQDADVVAMQPQTYDDMILADSPLCYLPLDEQSGTNFRDFQNSQTGTSAGTPKYGLGGPLLTDGAVDLTAASTNVLLGTMGSIGSGVGSSTIEFWILATSSTSNWIMGTVGTAASSGIFTVKANSPSTGRTEISIDDQAQGHLRTGNFGPTLYDGQWHHVVIQPSVTGTHAAWVDGIPQTVTMTATNTMGTNVNYTYNWTLGGEAVQSLAGVFNRYPFRIAKFAAYTTQLTQAKIVARMQKALQVR